MDGYVKGVTEFEETLYNYINDVKNTDFCDTITLNYINSQIIEQPDDVDSFIKNLEPNSFKEKGGNRATTDIANLFKLIFKEQKENEIAVLVSDFVFSPGKNNAEDYLTMQRLAIKELFVSKLKTGSNYVAEVYRLSSQFDGYYYNKYDSPIKINNKRPYFIWILGNRNQVKRLTNSVKKERIIHGVSHSYSISERADALPYGILLTPRIGSFKIDPVNPKTNIQKTKIDKKDPRRLIISFGVDFSDLLLEDSYLTDIDNYAINNKAYNIESVEKNSYTNSSYTHIIKLKLNQPVISRGVINIQLLKKPVSWANQFTDYDGENIQANDAINKTFGFKYLTDGVFDAYTSSDTTYAVFTINIQ